MPTGLKTSGRIRRRAYFIRLVGIYSLGAAFNGLPALAEYQLHDAREAWQWVALSGFAGCFYLIIAQAIKRLHDLDLKGWWLLLFFMPVGGYLLGGALQLVSGTTGPSRYGPDPRDSSMASVPT